LSFVTIARITRTRGVRGEVAAALLTDFPDRFKALGQVTLRRGDATFVEHIESFWFHKDRVILKFRGRDRPHEVEQLVGCLLQVPARERYPVPDDTYFDDDLRGCAVLEEGRRLGVVSSVYRATDSVHNLVVRCEDGQEFMIPLVEAFVREIDLEAAVVHVRLPDGLVEVTSSPGDPETAPESARKR